MCVAVWLCVCGSGGLYVCVMQILCVCLWSRGSECVCVAAPYILFRIPFSGDQDLFFYRK